MPNSARDIVRKVLPRNMADEIWSSRYDKALLASNEFVMSAVLPAVFYMFRFGQRRGRGRFLESFGPEDGTQRERRRKATVERVAKSLASIPEVQGFDGTVERAVLGDMLLCFCLENIRRELGRDRQIQRVAPTHYLASWVDLPESVTALRSVPEMIVAMLANQSGEHVEPNDDGDRTWFAVARGFERNVLLRPFLRGVSHHGKVLDDLKSDRFDERDESVGIDQLLMIRLAKQLGEAPQKNRESARIANQRPIAERAAEYFSEDIRSFVRAYAELMPRYAFIDMLESCISTGMTAILTSVVEILFVWSDTGTVPPKHHQQPAGIFVDCSNGVDIRLRDLAEQSLDDLMRRVERVPVVLMLLRLLDYAARHNRRVRKEDIRKRPYATEWFDLLGALLHERHDEAPFIRRTIEDQGEQLAEELEKEYPEASATLRNDAIESNPIRRFAAGFTLLLGSMPRSHLMAMVDSTLQVGRPNGLARKRVTTRGVDARPRRDVRSLVLSDSVLDFLVHLKLLRSSNGGRLRQRPLSLSEFLERLRDRYGFHVDTAPDGMTISNELLQANRRVLERRLRDLGLLIGVNDAEAMKRLRARFELEEA